MQGIADAGYKISQAEFFKTIDFLATPFKSWLTRDADKEASLSKDQKAAVSPEDQEAVDAVHKHCNQNSYII